MFPTKILRPIPQLLVHSTRYWGAAFVKGLIERSEWLLALTALSPCRESSCSIAMVRLDSGRFVGVGSENRVARPAGYPIVWRCLSLRVPSARLFGCFVCFYQTTRTVGERVPSLPPHRECSAQELSWHCRSNMLARPNENLAVPLALYR